MHQTLLFYVYIHTYKRERKRKREREYHIPQIFLKITFAIVEAPAVLSCVVVEGFILSHSQHGRFKAVTDALYSPHVIKSSRSHLG